MLSVLTTLAQSSSYYTDTSYYSSSTTADSAAAGAAVAVIFLIIFVLFIVAYVFMGICLSKIFKKAGRQDSWAAWVPIYNSWVLYEVAGKPGWWSLAGLIPFVGGVLSIVLGIIMSVELAKAFNKQGGFAALLILLPVVGYPMLAFGDAQYTAPAPATATGFPQPNPAYAPPAATTTEPAAPAQDDTTQQPPQIPAS